MLIGFAPSAFAQGNDTIQAAYDTEVKMALEELSEVRSSTQLSDQELITRTIELFSEARIDQLNNYESEQYYFTEFFVPDYMNNSNLVYICDRFEWNRQMLKETGAKNLWYDVHTEVLSMDIVGETAEVTFSEKYEYERVNHPGRVSFEGITYYVDMVKLDGIWLISDLTTDSSYDKANRDEGIDVDAKMRAVRLGIGEQTSELIYTPTIDENSTSVARASMRIDTDKFVEYARKYAENYNDNFCNYKELNQQGYDVGDCQNFASQCVWAGFGGINDLSHINSHAEPMVDLSYSNDRDWFQEKEWVTDSGFHWTTVVGFGNYISTQNYNSIGPRGNIYSGVAYAGVGSIVQIGSAEEGGYYHSYVVVEADGTYGNRTFSDLTVCSHTEDYCDKNLGELYDPDAYYRTIHINAANY